MLSRRCLSWTVPSLRWRLRVVPSPGRPAVRFYDRWLRGDPPARALRFAQLSLLDGGEFADEFFRVPYAVTGS